MAFDIEQIREVLRAATTRGSKFSQRSLSAAAGEGRDCVGDIINGRNKNPTIKVLTNLSKAMGKDVSVFGVISIRTDPPSVGELQQALADLLPGMPTGSIQRRAQYLAENVANVLGLPPTAPPIGAIVLTDAAGASAEAAPPRGPTK